MIRIPGQELGLLGKRLQEWESWMGSLVRLSNAHAEFSDVISDGALFRQLQDAVRKTQEAISDLQDRIHKTRDLFEGSDAAVGRAVGRIFDQFSLSFDTRCLESLHLSSVENDVHRLSLSGTISPTVIPGVTLLVFPTGEGGQANGV